MTGDRRDSQRTSATSESECRDGAFAFPSQRQAVPRVSDDVASQNNVALLERLLQPTNADVCRRLLERANWKLRNLGSFTLHEMCEMGLTERRIAMLRALVELAKRFGEEEWQIGSPFRGSYDVYAHFRERLAAERVEKFYAVLLDNKNRKLTDILVGQGSLTASIVHPRDVYLPIIRESAAAVLFVHNHPSGDPTPSKEDLEITRRLREVGELIGVRVLDHVVIGRGRYVSFVDDGYW